MQLVVFEKGARIRQLECRHEAVYIGSGADCGVRFDDERLAERLAVICPESESGWVIQTLLDTDEIEINGERLVDERLLLEGDRIRFYDYHIQVHLEEIASDDAPIAGKATVASMAQFVRFQLPSGAIIKRADESIQVERAHLTRVGKLNVLLGGCNTPEALMEVALKSLLETFSAHRVWVGLRRVNYGSMEYVEGRLLAGHTTDLPETGENLTPRVLDRGQFILLPRAGQEEPISVMIGPLIGPDGTLGMVYLDSGETNRRFKEPEFDVFILFLAALAAQLDAIFKQITKQRAATVEGEVSVAHAIQSRLTPRKLPQWDALQFGAFRELGRERTSDVYDVVRLGNGMAAFLIAYTGAVGSLASQHMAQAQAAFRSALMHMDSPHNFFRLLSVLLYDGQSGHGFHCMMGAIEPTSGSMEYALAGEIGSYIISARGEERSLRPARVDEPIGTVKNATFVTHTATLGSEENLVLFTPGVVTARSRAGEIFGEDRFVNILCDGFGQIASSTLKEMLTDLQSFTEGGSQPEDITVILAHHV